MVLPQALLLVAFGLDQLLSRRSRVRREQEFQKSQVRALQEFQQAQAQAFQELQQAQAQALQESQQWQAMAFLVCFLFLMGYVLRQFWRQDKTRNHDQRQLRSDLETIRGQLRRQDEMRDRDRLQRDHDQRQLRTDLETIRGQLRLQDETRNHDQLQLRNDLETIRGQLRRQDETRNHDQLQLRNDLETIRGQLRRQDETRNHDQLQLRNDLETIRGQFRLQDEMRDRDRLHLGIHFATIYDVWGKNNTKEQDIRNLFRSPTRSTEVCKVYDALRNKVKDQSQFRFPTTEEDKKTTDKAKEQSSALRSIFRGPDKSLAHIVPSSLVCSWFYGSVAERLVGTAVGAEDAGTEDAGTEDAGTEDAGAEDAGTEDAGTEDAGTEDAGTEDAGTEDAGTEDAGTAEERAMQRFMLIHDRDHGLKYSSRNLLPLPDHHDKYFDKCIGDCLLIIPIMTPAEMAEWNGQAYDVLVVASSLDVYRWMKLDDQFLKQKSPTTHEITTATTALRTCIADLLHDLLDFLVPSGNGPIADGRHLVKKYEREKTRETPSTFSTSCSDMAQGESAVSFASETADGTGKSTGSDKPKSSNGTEKSSGSEKQETHPAERKTSNLEKWKSKIKEKGFPMPKQQEDVEKPLLKVSLKDLAESSSVPDPLALATKAAINWAAFATVGNMKLLTGCRVTPPIVEGGCDGPDAGISEEMRLPKMIYVPTNQGLVRPIPRTATDWSGSQQPHLVSP